MSNVTNAILAFGCPTHCEAEDIVAAVNKCIGDSIGFKLIENSSVGGTKVLETEIALAAFNYFHASVDGDDETLIDRLKRLPWEEWGCSYCQLMLMYEWHDGFGIREIHRAEHADTPYGSYL